MSESSTFSIYIELDMLFDTFMGAVTLVDPTLEDILIKGGYYKRNTNDLSKLLPGRDIGVIEHIYENRGIEVLANSKSTNLTYLLKSLCSTGMEVVTIDEPDGIETKLVFNTYPYTLSPEEVKEIATVLSEILEIRNIHRVHVHPKDLRPRVIKKRYDRVFLYDFNQWLGHHLDNLAACPIPNVTFNVPFIQLKDIEETNLLETVEHYSRKAFVRHLDLELLPLDYVSLVQENIDTE